MSLAAPRMYRSRLAGARGAAPARRSWRLVGEHARQSLDCLSDLPHVTYGGEGEPQVSSGRLGAEVWSPRADEHARVAGLLRERDVVELVRESCPKMQAAVGRPADPQLGKLV